jgi:hypothetical protein
MFCNGYCQNRNKIISNAVNQGYKYQQLDTVKFNFGKCSQLMYAEITVKGEEHADLCQIQKCDFQCYRLALETM